MAGVSSASAAKRGSPPRAGGLPFRARGAATRVTLLYDVVGVGVCARARARALTCECIICATGWPQGCIGFVTRRPLQHHAPSPGNAIVSLPVPAVRLQGKMETVLPKAVEWSGRAGHEHRTTVNPFFFLPLPLHGTSGRMIDATLSWVLSTRHGNLNIKVYPQ